MKEFEDAEEGADSHRNQTSSFNLLDVTITDIDPEQKSCKC